MNRNRTLKVGTLVATHVLIGAILLAVAIVFKGANWSSWTMVGYIAFLGSQLMLLGMWLGLSSASWWSKLLGLVVGVAWVATIPIGPSFPDLSGQVGVDECSAVVIIMLACTLGVASTLGLLRKLVVRIHWREHWHFYPLLHDLQFSIGSLLGLTTLTGALVAVAKFVKPSDPGLDLFPMCVIFAVGSTLDTWIVAWAGLGCGQLKIRVPMSFGVVIGVGLLMALYARTLEYLEYAAVSLIAAGITLATLLVVRSCGYRLVSLRNLPVEEKE